MGYGFNVFDVIIAHFVVIFISIKSKILKLGVEECLTQWNNFKYKKGQWEVLSNCDVFHFWIPFLVHRLYLNAASFVTKCELSTLTVTRLVTYLE